MSIIQWLCEQHIWLKALGEIAETIVIIYFVLKIFHFEKRVAKLEEAEE